MATYVALLRAINVGGRRSVAMADLRTIVTEAGGQDVQTYIQSGNVVFDHSSRSPSTLTIELEERIEAATGFAVPVTLRTASQIDKVVQANPFPDAPPAQLAVSFLHDQPAAGATDRLDPAKFAPDAFVLAGRDVYLHLPNGFGRAKLPGALDVVAPGTARNWNTVVKLQSLAGS